MQHTIRKLRGFVRDSRGLVTIEWVMISAVVVVVSISITAFVLNSAGNLGVSVSNKLEHSMSNEDNDN